MDPHLLSVRADEDNHNVRAHLTATTLDKVELKVEIEYLLHDKTLLLDSHNLHLVANVIHFAVLMLKKSITRLKSMTEKCQVFSVRSGFEK